MVDDAGADDSVEDAGFEVLEGAAVDVVKRVVLAPGWASASLFKLFPFTRFLPVISLRT